MNLRSTLKPMIARTSRGIGRELISQADGIGEKANWFVIYSFFSRSVWVEEYIVVCLDGNKSRWSRKSRDDGVWRKGERGNERPEVVDEGEWMPRTGMWC